MVTEYVAAHLGLLGELAGLLVIVAGVIVAAGFVIARCDKIPLEDAMYLAVITAFTVGFGDLTPQSRGARLACVVLAFLGLIMMGVLVAVAVHALDIAMAAGSG